ncbi:oligosaccharide flippase family protein [Aeromonas veronii]
MNEEIRTVIKNSIYLLLTKGLTYIFPLFILGYLIKSLGVVAFGQYSIALTICTFVLVLVDYGFSLTTSREIAKNRECKKTISTLFLETTLLRLLFTLISYPFYYFICKFYFDDDLVFISSQIAFSFVIGNALFPIWFFQGIEKLGFVSILSVFSKLLSFFMIVYFVNDEDDIGIAFLAQAIPLLLVSVLSNIVILKKYIVFDLSLVTRSGLLTNIKEGWSVFLSSLSASILTNSATLILGGITTDNNVGLYSAAERLAKAASALYSPITQSVYPYNCRKFALSASDGYASVRKTGAPIIFLAALGAMLIYATSGFLQDILTLNNQSVDILNVFSVWIFFGVANNVLGIQTLCASSNARVYSRSFIICACISLVLIAILSSLYHGLGAAIAITTGEIMLTALLLYFIKKLKQNLLRF